MTAVVPSEHEFVQPPNRSETYLLFSSRYPSVLLPGYPLEWVLHVLGLHTSRWQTGGVRRASYKKKYPPDCIVCLLSATY